MYVSVQEKNCSGISKIQTIINEILIRMHVRTDPNDWILV